MSPDPLPLGRPILTNETASAEEEMMEYTLAADPFSMLIRVRMPEIVGGYCFANHTSTVRHVRPESRAAVLSNTALRFSPAV
jgi:hypothetical protein